MTIVAGLFLVLFDPQRGALAALPGILLYTLLVGASPAVVCAAIMVGLSFVAFLMGPFDPDVLWDVGFTLSFMDTLGLVLYA